MSPISTPSTMNCNTFAVLQLIKQNNSGRYEPIFKILSPADLQEICW